VAVILEVPEVQEASRFQHILSTFDPDTFRTAGTARLAELCRVILHHAAEREAIWSHRSPLIKNDRR